MEDPAERLAIESSEEVDAALNDLYRGDATVCYIKKLAALKGWSELETYKRLAVTIAREKGKLTEMYAQLLQITPVTMISKKEIE